MYPPPAVARRIIFLCALLIEERDFECNIDVTLETCWPLGFEVG